MSLTDYVKKAATGLALAGTLAGAAYAGQKPIVNNQMVGRVEKDFNQDGRNDELQAFVTTFADKNQYQVQIKSFLTKKTGEGQYALQAADNSGLVDTFYLPDGTCFRMVQMKMNKQGEWDRKSPWGANLGIFPCSAQTEEEVDKAVKKYRTYVNDGNGNFTTIQR